MTDSILNLSKKFLRATQRGNINELMNLSNQHNIDNWTIFRHDISGDTALHIAAREGYMNIVEYLCNNWYNPTFKVNVVNVDMKCPLHEAAQFSRNTIVDFLIQKGASVDSLKRSDWTPLMMACTKNGIDALSCINGLLKAGANSTIQNKDGWTPLHLACRVGNVNIIKLLLTEKPECASILTNNGRTSLHIAAFHGHINAIDALISVQPNLLHICDSTGVTPLHEAVKSRNFNLFKHLLNLGSNVHKVDTVGQTVLHVAASVGNIDVINYILVSGLIDIQCKDNFGIMPLALAQRNEIDINCIDLLKKYM